ncbi:MAG TPA: GDSL-type esterase/lipase family protein [Candidatus Limnocylindria bacterium]|nr:GDSL-type esterase/lipase family protein [Candidatus Limnocylindria bacterium]
MGRTRSALLVAMLVAVISASSSTAAAAVAPAMRLYVALGDSLAAGVGASDPARTAYVPLLFQYFMQPRAENVRLLRNLSRPGETSDSLIAGGQLALALAAIEDPTTDTRVVTLDIGGNDILFLTFSEPCRSDPGGAACQALVDAQLRKFALNYALILTALQSALAHDPGRETLFVMTYYNPYGGTGHPYEPFADDVLLGSDLVIDCSAPAGDPRAGLNDLIACGGAAAGAAVADVYPVFGDRAPQLTHISAGDIHPNDAGYALIAQTFIAAD